jgi:hypothetical protein
MKTIVRDVPGHCCISDRCSFYLHTDIVEDNVKNAFDDTLYCVSLIGEYRDGWNMLNASGKTYELMVFGKKTENPWSEIEVFLTNDKAEAISKHSELVNKYLQEANRL